MGCFFRFNLLQIQEGRQWVNSRYTAVFPRQIIFVSRFDQIIPRQQTGSSKWDKYADSDILPMWVADMDFAAPPAIVEAISKRTAHGIFGYNEPPPGLIDVVLNRLSQRYGVHVTETDLVFGPCVVPALNQTCRGWVRSGEKVVTVTPVYHPFLAAPGNFGHELITIPALESGNTWGYPFAALEACLADNPEISLLLLCNPHNPIGHCLTADDLFRIVEICLAHNVVICSDEIHCDLVFDGRDHYSTLACHPRAADIVMTLMAASKTFNVAGLGGYVAVIPNTELRERFEAAGEGIMANVTTFAYTAMQVAWRDCEDWRLELLDYLQGNRAYLEAAVATIDGINVNRVQGTYLAWLDVRSLALADALTHFEKAGLGLSPGAQFGGDGFMRLNFGCPRVTLEKACERLKSVV